MIRASMVGASVGLGFAVCVMAQTGPDLAEANAGAWRGRAPVDGAATSVAASTARMKDGVESLLFTTASGFDTWAELAPAGGLNLDARAFNFLTFWEYGENGNDFGWQGEQPIVKIRGGGSSGAWSVTLTWNGAMPNGGWRLFKAPLAGGEGWTRTQTGTVNWADVDAIELHHDTWGAGFRVWIDGVRFRYLDANSLPPQGPPPPAGVDPDAIDVKVLHYVINPRMAMFGNRRMNEVYGWGDPFALAASKAADLLASSHGKARFQIVETVDDERYPYLENGFQYTDATFDDAWRRRDFVPGTFDYTRFVTEHGLGARVDAGEIDEVWVYAFPGTGMWESAMAGRGAYWINGGAYPNAGGERAFVVMGLNYERGVGEAIHSWGHRSESIMVHCYGSWTPNRSNLWSRFALLDRDGEGQGGVGNVHFPVNGESDYDYANPRQVWSNADAWLTFPVLTETTRLINWREWSPDGRDPQRQYLNWWYGHMPHVGGRGPDAYLANWWRYLIDVDQFKNGGASMRLTLGIPAVRVTSPTAGAEVSGVTRVRADAEVDGALGRVDFYVDGVFVATDSLTPYTFEWNTAGLFGEHTIVAKAYELQNGTESVSAPVVVRVAGCEADFNGDGFLDFFDYAAFVECFEVSVCPQGRDADVNGDDFVDFFDYADFVGTFESGC